MLVSTPFPPTAVPSAESPKMYSIRHRQEDSPHTLFSSFPGAEPIPLPARFAKLKHKLVAGRDAAITTSWHRLLDRLRTEVDKIASSSSAELIPTIEFSQIDSPQQVDRFRAQLKECGAGIIRKVVSQKTALSWNQEINHYLTQNPQTKGFPSCDPQLYELYWSPGQIKARADPNVLAAQRFAMSVAWTTTRNPAALVSTAQPVCYADRLRMRRPGDTALALSTHCDSGSVERWEPDGYGRAGTYDKIWAGDWEAYDPWDASTRLGVTSDLYNGAGRCSVFRMFQGTIALSPCAPGEGTLLVCPMLQLSTAYILLRPLFTPQTPLVGGDVATFLDKKNWVLRPDQDSVLHGALPGYTQEVNSLLHPHLQLDRSMVSIPEMEPGDYVIWHPDTVHAADKVHRGKKDSSALYVPCCPLTQTNVLFLSGQRRAFLLGKPGPDFEGGRGERDHVNRPGVQEVSDAGGDDGLRAMGLMPFDEDTDNPLIQMANAILFPDRYDMI